MQHYARCSVCVSSGLQVRLTTVQLTEQMPGVLRALGRSQLQPVTRLLRLIDRRLSAQSTVFELSAAISSASRLPQQFMANAAVAGIAAITAKHLPQSALSNHHTATGRLFEQTTGKVFNAGLLIQARVIQQP